MKKYFYIFLSLLALVSMAGCKKQTITTTTIPTTTVHEHDFELSEVVAPTCLDDGYSIYTCVCGKTENRDQVTKLGHNEDDVKHQDATCTEKGYTKKYCTRCNELVSEEIFDEILHVASELMTNPARCEVEGLSYITCLVCKNVIYSKTIPALSHNRVLDINQDATCLEGGLVVYKCDICNEELERTETKALGHDFETIKEVSATCLKDGVSEGVKCKRCKFVQSGFEKIEALGHEIITEGAVTSLGHSYDSTHCTRCSYEYRTNLKCDPTKLYGYNYLKENFSNGEKLCRLYLDMYEAGLELLASTKDYAKTNVDGTFSKVKTFTIDCEFETCKNHTNYGLTVTEAGTVIRTLSLENPELLFFYGGYYNGTSTEFHTMQGSSKLFWKTTTISITISDDYLKGEYRQEIKDALIERNKEIAQLMNGVTGTANKAVVIHDYIINSFDYQYLEDGKTPQTARWAHDLTGFALLMGGVCETYAKAYQYYSYLYDINSIIVHGDNHAWNMTKYGDYWYGMDLTWDDKKNDTNSYKYFGASYDQMCVQTSGHNAYPETPGINYMYGIPSNYASNSWQVISNGVRKQVLVLSEN